MTSTVKERVLYVTWVRVVRGIPTHATDTDAEFFSVYDGEYHGSYATRQIAEDAMKFHNVK